MIIGIPKECAPGETRVAAVPATLAPLLKAGHEVWIEPGAGEKAGFPDAAYAAKGAKAAPSRRALFEKADALLQVRGPLASLPEGKADLAAIRKGQVLAGFHEPYAVKEDLLALAATGAAVFSLELLPRTSRAQAMDALSSMAMIAGYKAALLAAEHLPKVYPMMVTAGGTLAASRAFVIGAGVAGLSAIATCRRLGAQVSAYDLRAEVREEIQSLGARFVDLGIGPPPAAGQGGYAAAQGEEYSQRQREALAKVVAEQDVVIATAAIPGRKSPLLVTADAVRRMAPGSVIVDLAAERGGNCELARPGETVVENGVAVLAPGNLPATVPNHASLLFAKNVATLFLHVVKDGKTPPDLSDDIVAGTLLARDGRVVHARAMQVAGIPAGGTA